MKMNSHSEAWNERKWSLSQREKVLKGELESVSSDFERKAKYVLITSLITGGVFLIANKAFGGSRKKNKKKKQADHQPKVVAKPSFSIKNIVMEKLTMAIAGFLLVQLKEILSGHQNKENKEAKGS